MTADTSPPTSAIHRFARFIEALKRGMADGIGRRHDALGPLALLLLSYLGRTLRRLEALHARFAAGTLAVAPRRSAAPHPAPDRPRAVRRPPRLPPGPVLLRFHLVHFASQLQALVDDPEMRALLAASPQAGRLLRPLWRKLATDPLPEPLRLPCKPRQAKAKPQATAPKPARTARAARPPATPAEPPQAASTRWEPPPCLPPWPPPPLPA